MSKIIRLKNRIKTFNNEIYIPGDKSPYKMGTILSLANGVSTAKNLLMSEDVLGNWSNKVLGN